MVSTYYHLGAAFSLLNVFLFSNGGLLVNSQPTQDLDPEDTEAIIAAFLNNATEQGWNDTTVNDMLEEILRQDAIQGGTAGGGESMAVPTPVPVPYHRENPPISTPTQEDEEVPEEEEEEEEREEDPNVPVC